MGSASLPIAGIFKYLRFAFEDCLFSYPNMKDCLHVLRITSHHKLITRYF